MCLLLLCGRLQSNHDNKEILLCTLLIDGTTLAEKTAHISIDFSFDAKEAENSANIDDCVSYYCVVEYNLILIGRSFQIIKALDVKLAIL